MRCLRDLHDLLRYFAFCLRVFVVCDLLRLPVSCLRVLNCCVVVVVIHLLSDICFGWLGWLLVGDCLLVC